MAMIGAQSTSMIIGQRGNSMQRQVVGRNNIENNSRPNLQTYTGNVFSSNIYSVGAMGAPNLNASKSIENNSDRKYVEIVQEYKKKDR